MGEINSDSVFVEDGFGEVVDVFRSHFKDGLEVGASVVAYVGDKKVVDIAAGYRDIARSQPYTSSTPVVVFSSTKGITAIAIHIAISQGLISYETQIAEVWPSFAEAGKASITLGDTLSHRSGVAIVENDLLTLSDVQGWDLVIEALERQVPIWEPGSRHGYHLRTFGWIHGEVLRRLYNRDVPSIFNQLIAVPLGVELDLSWSQKLDGSIAEIVTDPPRVDVEVQIDLEREAGLSQYSISAIHGPGRLFAYDQRWNEVGYRSLAMPSSSAMISAETLSSIYKGVVIGHNGIRLLSDEIIKEAIRERSRGVDEILGRETAFGMGFALAPMIGESLPPSAFGHPGAGGSLGFGDLEAEVSFGYTMNKMASALINDQRSNELAAALYRCL